MIIVRYQGMDFYLKENEMMENATYEPFICFAAEDRYCVAEPIVYHLKNYGIETWYDRHRLVMGDNRIKKNLIEGVSSCKYAIVVLSQHTHESICAMEEISIIEKRFYNDAITVFPILYELSPEHLPNNLQWIKKLVFKEVNKKSGTREICNHIACKITEDLLESCEYQQVRLILGNPSLDIPPATYMILSKYNDIDCFNLNSRVSLLYAAHLTMIHSNIMDMNPTNTMLSKIFERLFSETKLNLDIDYREIRLLENAICILIDNYLSSCTESKM